MSIAEKLTIVAENQPHVYAAGFKSGLQEGYVQGHEEGEASGYSLGVQEGYAQGVQAEYDRIWNAYQPNGGASTCYDYAFAGCHWTDDTFEPKYDIVAWSAVRMFEYSGITDLRGILEQRGLTLTITASNCTNAFASSTITRLPIISLKNSKSNYAYFSYCKKLVSIQKLIMADDGTTGYYNGSFQYCESLEELIIEGVLGKNGFNVSWSPKLTHESLMSIINALADKQLEGGTTWEVTLGEENLAKLTDDEKEIAYNKGWVIS